MREQSWLGHALNEGSWVGHALREQSWVEHALREWHWVGHAFREPANGILKKWKWPLSGRKVARQGKPMET